MTPTEIIALTEQGLTLIAKVVDLIKSAQKGELTPGEAKQLLADYAAEMKAAVDDAHAYLDKQFDTP